jgi:hypothetical protein
VVSPTYRLGEANSLIGNVSHLAWVERPWFHSIVGGGQPDDEGQLIDGSKAT